jgi:hypothetical protein
MPLESRPLIVRGRGIIRKNKAIKPVDQPAPELADSSAEILVELRPDFVQRAATRLAPQLE